MKKIKSAFRYPGSKEKISASVMSWFPDSVTCGFSNRDLSVYCEPFIGCGAMTVKILPNLPRTTNIILNDKDYGIACLWRTILTNLDKLIRLLLDFQPSVEAFELFKREDGDTSIDELTAGFRKFVFHQISFSGLGAKAGGPLGGKSQKEGAKYLVDCRFRPERHAKVLVEQRNLLQQFASVKVLYGDFADALAIIPSDGFAYLDPPYYLQGGVLYKHNMEPAEHIRLRELLKSAKYDWVLSYDNHHDVRDLYAEWSDIHSFEMTATIETKRGSKSRRKNNELVITKRES